jgi:hypothetical protein
MQTHEERKKEFHVQDKAHKNEQQKTKQKMPRTLVKE